MNLTVVGAYLPELTPIRVREWIVEDVRQFVEGIRDLQKRGFAESWTDENIRERATELPRELEESLFGAALFEVLVENHDGRFDPNDIFERNTTSVAWAPAYLTVDGLTRIAEDVSELFSNPAFRVAFYVHEGPSADIGECPLSGRQSFSLGSPGHGCGRPVRGQKLPFKGTDCQAKALSPLASQTQHGWGAV